MMNVSDETTPWIGYRMTLAIVSATAIAMLGFMAGRMSAAHETRCGVAGVESRRDARSCDLELDFSPSPAESEGEGPRIEPPSPFGFNQPG